MWSGIFMPAAARLAGAMSMPLTVGAHLAGPDAGAGDDHRHADAAFVQELLVAMKFVAVIAEAENERGLGEAILLQFGQDFTDLLIGLEQAIVVMGDLLTHERDVRVIGQARALWRGRFSWARGRRVCRRVIGFVQRTAAGLRLRQKFCLLLGL